MTGFLASRLNCVMPLVNHVTVLNLSQQCIRPCRIVSGLLVIMLCTFSYLWYNITESGLYILLGLYSYFTLQCIYITVHIYFDRAF